jgi:SAM-dependent methyltransferase
MLQTTISRLRCLCGGKLSFAERPNGPEIRSGSLGCSDCGAAYLILAGVALLVEDPHEYLLSHVKGVSKIVPDSEIPEDYRGDFLEAKSELDVEHIEEDLEAERVNALYLMTHFLRADSGEEWWKPESGAGDPLIDRLVREFWNRGPFAEISGWLKSQPRFGSTLELGCGVGGLSRVLAGHTEDYLGVDSSFASVALARHLALGTPYPGKLRIPGDLLQGGVSREVTFGPPTEKSSGDFVVADLSERAPLAPGWDLTIALNTIDMLREPESLPRIQRDLLRDGGWAIQSCPYIWHESVARELRERLPADLRGDSRRAVEWMYGEAGFKIEKTVDHLPWLFFKHLRQLEIYSVHLFAAQKC